LLHNPAAKEVQKSLYSQVLLTCCNIDSKVKFFFPEYFSDFQAGHKEMQQLYQKAEMMNLYQPNYTYQLLL
jgi:hypothetical protein